MTPVGVAVVGAGYWGANLIRNFATLTSARLLYVCDLDHRRLATVRERHPDVPTISSLPQLLADAAVQAVVVVTPAESHRAVAEACLRAGRDVFVEKPLASTAADARALVELAEQQDRVLLVGHLFMYDATVGQTIQLVQERRAGEIRYVTGVRTSMGGTARLDTNIVWDALIHDAYVMPAICGRPPLRVQAVGRGYLSDLEDVVFATFDFGGGVLAHCYASWYALEKARRITVIGSDGILHLDEFAPSPVTFFNRRYRQDADRDVRGRPRWRWLDEGAEPQPVERTEPLRAECEHFIECVRTRRRPRTDGRSALAAVRVIQACQMSLQADGAWVPLEQVHG